MCFFKKSSVSSEDVESIINDLFTEDQKKVLHHYHRCRERNCSGLRTDEKQRLSSKKETGGLGLGAKWSSRVFFVAPTLPCRFTISVSGN